MKVTLVGQHTKMRTPIDLTNHSKYCSVELQAVGEDTLRHCYIAEWQEDREGGIGHNDAYDVVMNTDRFTDADYVTLKAAMEVNLHNYWRINYAYGIAALLPQITSRYVRLLPNIKTAYDVGRLYTFHELDGGLEKYFDFKKFGEDIMTEWSRRGSCARGIMTSYGWLTLSRITLE